MLTKKNEPKYNVSWASLKNSRHYFMFNCTADSDTSTQTYKAHAHNRSHMYKSSPKIPK